MDRLIRWCGLFSKLAADWEQYVSREPLTQRMEGLPEEPPFSQLVQQPEYKEDPSPLIMNEGEDIREEPELTQYHDRISNLISAYQKFHETEDPGLKRNYAEWIFMEGESLRRILPRAIGWESPVGKLRNWMDTLIADIKREFPESMVEQMMIGHQKAQEWKHRGRTSTREMDDIEFEAMLEAMQERMENEATRRFKQKINPDYMARERFLSRQRYLAKLLTEWKEIEDPEEKERMKNRVVNLLQMREQRAAG